MRLAIRADKQRHQQQWMFYFSTEQQRTKQEGPDISLLEPALQKQWDHAANAHLGNIVIKPFSSKEVHWTCDQCPDGYPHSWSALVRNRSCGNGCPQCSGHKVCQHNSLATKAPKIAAQWDYEENDGTPDSVVAHSNQAAGWLCDTCGRKWRVRVDARVEGNTGCPQCFELARGAKRIKRPTFAECQDPDARALLAQWDHEQNAAENKHPHHVTLCSNKQIHWLCTKCSAGQKHRWSSQPYHRTGKSKTGCPVCAGKVACRCNSLQALYPDMAAEWDHHKNEGQPSDYSASSGHLAWWCNPQRGSWQQTITSRTDMVYKRTRRLQRVQHRERFAS